MRKDFEFIEIDGNIEGIVEPYELDRLIEEAKEKLTIKKKKHIPIVNSELRRRSVLVPEAIYECSGIIILGRRIKSILFTTDIALITNNNANAIMAVYPFTPSVTITQSIVESASVPVFAGVGGGTTSGERSVHMALQAELLGCYGTVVNAPMSNDNISQISEAVDVPVIATIASRHDDFEGKINAGAQILNVAGGKNTADLVSDIRKVVGKDFPIIATGGHEEKHILDTIKAGANAITYTPPTTGEIFESVMEDYRNKK